jgi:transcriptional regulator with XRE-family HTH domain
MTEFKDRLKELRKVKNLSRKELANALSCSEINIRGLENGRNYPRAETIIEAARFFEVTSDYLLGLSDDPKPHKFIDLEHVSTDDMMHELLRRWM